MSCDRVVLIIINFIQKCGNAHLIIPPWTNAVRNYKKFKNNQRPAPCTLHLIKISVLFHTHFKTFFWRTAFLWQYSFYISSSTERDQNVERKIISCAKQKEKWLVALPLITSSSNHNRQCWKHHLQYIQDFLNYIIDC